MDSEPDDDVVQSGTSGGDMKENKGEGCGREQVIEIIACWAYLLARITS